MYRMRNNGDCMLKNSLLNMDFPWLHCFGYFLVSLFSISLFFSGVVLYSVDIVDTVGLLSFGIGLILLLAYAVFLLCDWRFDAKLNFLVIAVPAVISFALFLLPGCVPDEGPHIWQAAAVLTRGPAGFDVPTAYLELNLPKSYSDVYYSLTHPTDWEDVFLCERYLGTYYLHLYMIPATVIEVFRLLGFNTLLALFAARICSGMVFVAAGCLFLHLMPYGKTWFLVFLLNPMLIQQEASCSADSVANVVAIGYFVAVLVIYSEKIYTRKSAAAMICFSVLLVLSKAMFAPLVLLNLVYLGDIFKSGKLFKAYLLVLATCLLLVAIVTTFYSGSFMRDSFELMKDPLHCLMVLLRSIWEVGPFWFESYAGSSLGALSISTWSPALIFYFMIQAVVLFYNDEAVDVDLNMVQKALFSIVSLVNFFLIIISMREWTLSVDHREDIIMGVQGRYLIPLVSPILLCILRSHPGVSSGKVMSTVCGLLIGILALDIYTVMASFV